jgi:uncharacterized protein (DUF488 family)
MERGAGEKQRINDQDPAGGVRVFTIGHSGHDLGPFVGLLRRHAITLVADVRSRPYSGRLPQFNRAELRQALAEWRIDYAFLGDLLGGRPEEPDLYDESRRADYERVRQTAAFAAGLEQLHRLRTEHAVALLCAEEDPLDCHRGLLIAPALAAQGVAVSHIRGDGRAESLAEAEDRLLRLTFGELSGDLFGRPTGEERADLLAQAYREHGRRKAFRLSPDGRLP